MYYQVSSLEQYRVLAKAILCLDEKTRIKEFPLISAVLAEVGKKD